MQGHTADSYSAHPPGLPGPFLQSKNTASVKKKGEQEEVETENLKFH